MSTYRKIDADTLGITPDEYTQTRQQILEEKSSLEAQQAAAETEYDARINDCNVKLTVLDA